MPTAASIVTLPLVSGADALSHVGLGVFLLDCAVTVRFFLSKDFGLPYEGLWLRRKGICTGDKTYGVICY